MDIEKSINVFGKKLEICCNSPKTGFFRTGLCDTCKDDIGVHTVCILATDHFLKFSQTVGNDLSTPNSTYDFPGIKPGDRWCLCALRWQEAYESDKAPPVFLESTHINTLKYIDYNILQKFAVN